MSNSTTKAPEETKATEISKLEEREALKAELKAELLADISKESTPRGNECSGSKQKKQEADANSWLEEKVMIKLFKDGHKYKDDLTLSINSETVRIMRGVPVQVKRKFAMLIDESELQIVKASEYDEEQQSEYKSAVASQML